MTAETGEKTKAMQIVQMLRRLKSEWRDLQQIPGVQGLYYHTDIISDNVYEQSLITFGHSCYIALFRQYDIDSSGPQLVCEQLFEAENEADLQRRIRRQQENLPGASALLETLGQKSARINYEKNKLPLSWGGSSV